MLVEDIYKIENKINPENGFYKIRIAEFEEERTFLNDLQLIKILHPEEVKVGVLNGEIIAYEDMIKPDKFKSDGKIWNLDKTLEKERGGKAFLKFKNTDGRDLLVNEMAFRGGRERVDEAERILNKLKRDEINKFSKKALVAIGISLALAARNTVRATDEKQSIHYFLKLDQDKEKGKIAVNHPRENMSHKMIDLNPHLSETSKGFELEMQWTSLHRFSPVGLARKASSKHLKKEIIDPVKITHSDKKNSLNQIEKGGLTIAPGDMLTVEFPATEEDENCSFFLKSRGYYEKF